MLVIVASAAANDTPASLDLYPGNVELDFPGFRNVGRSSTGNASVVYLGGGWIITANHVTIADPGPGITGGVFFKDALGVDHQYMVDVSSKHQLTDPVNSGEGADLALYKIYGDPDIPAMQPIYLPTSAPSGHVYMIGNGLTRGAFHQWHVNTTTSPWVWTSSPPFNASGYDETSTRAIRWGENTVQDINQYINVGGGFGTIRYFTTVFDNGALTHEAQASAGDSGGAVFGWDGTRWVLAGIMNSTGVFSGQPDSTAVFSNTTLVADLSRYRSEILSYAGVVNRLAFYNNSGFDGDDTAINSSDDSAIATDKIAYLAGQGTAGSESVTSYDKGINGIMVDLASSHGALSLADFSFKMSPTGLAANNSPSTWAAAPTPTGFLVRPGQGEAGSDRIEFVWADGAIKDRWLQVTVEGNDAAGGNNTNTGLAASDTFYFGNKVGATFVDGQPGFFKSDAADQIAVRFNAGVTSSVTNVFDFNKDFSVDAIDEIVARFNGGSLNAINLSNPPAAPLPEFNSASDGSTSAVVSALASTSDPPEPAADAPRAIVLASAPTAPQLAARERIFASFSADEALPSLSAEADLAGEESAGDSDSPNT